MIIYYIMQLYNIMQKKYPDLHPNKFKNHFK